MKKSVKVILQTDFLLLLCNLSSHKKIIYIYFSVLMCFVKCILNYNYYKKKYIFMFYKLPFNQIKSNQITFIVTSPQHKCLGEWNSYERAPDSAEKQQTIYLWTDSAKKKNRQFTYGQTVQKTALEHLQCSRQCKKTTAIYIWTVHIYRLYRRQCAKYTYIYSVHIVYYKDIIINDTLYTVWAHLHYVQYLYIM